MNDDAEDGDQQTGGHRPNAAGHQSVANSADRQYGGQCFARLHQGAGKSGQERRPPSIRSTNGRGVRVLRHQTLMLPGKASG